MLLRNFETYPIRCLSDVWPSEILKFRLFCCFPQKTGYATHMIILAKEKGPFLSSHFGQSWKELSLADFRMYGNTTAIPPRSLTARPLKIDRAPKGKPDRLKQPSFFRGELLNFGVVQYALSQTTQKDVCSKSFCHVKDLVASPELI